MNPDDHPDSAPHPGSAGTSGNRWEPTDQAPPANPTAPQAQAQAQAQGQAQAPATEYAVAEPVARGPWLTRARATIAGGAAAVLLAGGLGGFAVGRATADDGGVQQGGPAGFDRDGVGDRGFIGGGPGQGMGQGPGQGPGQGTGMAPGPGQGQAPGGGQDLDGNDTQDS